MTVSASAAVVTVGAAGFAGTEVSVTIIPALAELDRLFPLALVATIVKVYDCPPENAPVAVSGLVVPALVVIEIDGDEVIVYPVILLPPLAGGVKVKLATVLLILVATPIIGASGTVVAVIEFEAMLGK